MKPILYAEDDDNDVYLMTRACEVLGIRQPLKIVTDGKMVIAYLADVDDPSAGVSNPLPCLVILDLSMPGRKGIEVLQWIRTQPKLMGLPVIVLTSSSQHTDIHRAYLLGASGFFVKPGDPDELLEIMRAVQACWLGDGPVNAKFHDLAAYRSPPAGATAQPR